mmetsp:Transcript_2705/g.8866  ORF Transcript_2705/g.8866 Transcript_2705/m.8866 type:complete len:237 (-) Transcript_2705:731-1441(-)
MSAERAWYQTSPFGSPVRSIMRGTSFTAQKIVPSRTSSTLSLVRTLYSKNAYCGRRSIFWTGTLYATCLAFLTTLALTSSLDVPDDHIMVTSSEKGGMWNAAPDSSPVPLPAWKVNAPLLSRTMATSCGSTRTSFLTSTISSSGCGKKRPWSVTSRCWPVCRDSTSTAVSSSTLTALRTAGLPSAGTSWAAGKMTASPRITRTPPVALSSSFTYWCCFSSKAWLVSPMRSCGEAGA